MIVSNVIHIDARPEVVWAVTCDIERWPEWTPTVTAARLVGDRAFGIGSVAQIEQPMQPLSDWRVTEFRDGERFAWETRRTGLHMVAAHEMTPDGAGTRNTLRVEATGPLALLLWPVLRWGIGRALRDENRGLKTRCEQQPSADAAT